MTKEDRQALADQLRGMANDIEAGRWGTVLIEEAADTREKPRYSWERVNARGRELARVDVRIRLEDPSFEPQVPDRDTACDRLAKDLAAKLRTMRDPNDGFISAYLQSAWQHVDDPGKLPRLIAVPVPQSSEGT